MLKEIGNYKECLIDILRDDEIIQQALSGENVSGQHSGSTAVTETCILPHLYIEPTADDIKSFIFLETYVQKTGNSIKDIKIVIQAVCRKENLSYTQKPEGYFGLRYDVLAQRTEELLCPLEKELSKTRIRQFGIGGLELLSVDMFFIEPFIGRTLTFLAPCFR